MIRHHIGTLPVHARQIAAVEIYDIVRKCKREVLLLPRSLQLGPYLTGKDVIAYKIAFAVMLMEARTLACVDQIVAQRDARPLKS